MNEWQKIDTSPKDGTPIQADIPGHGSDNIIAWSPGFRDKAGASCCCWVFMEDRDPPESWTDGVCWDENEDLEKSVEPTLWKWNRA